MRFLAGCLLGILLGLLLAGATVGGYLYMYPRPGQELLPAQKAQAADVTISVGQDYLNEQMRATLTERGLAAADSAFNLHAPNNATASASFAFLILGQTLTIKPQVYMHFGVSASRVRLDVDRIDVSGVTVPEQLVQGQVDSFRKIAEDEMNAEIKQYLTGTSLHLVSVDALEGELLVKLAR